MFNLLRRRLIGFATAFAATSLVATTPLMAQDSVVAEIQQRGALKVGLSLFVPWAMRDKKGDLVGFEIDVATKLAEDMGVEVEFYPTAWDGIIPALISGKFDAIISGMSITPQRNLTVNFSDPYAFSGFGVMANVELVEKMGLETMADFNQPSVTFAARRGATPAEAIRNAFPEAELILFDEDGAATQEVINANAVATMAAEPSPTWDIAKYPDTLFRPFDVPLQPTAEAFALRKGDPDALNFFNNWIAAQLRSGWLQERHNYWFKSVVWEDQVER